MATIVQTINTGTGANTLDGDSLRTAFQKINGDSGANCALPGTGLFSVLSWATPGTVINDGFGDATSAIQAAHDAAAVGGGDVFLPPGIYKTTSTINHTGAGVRIVGAGRSSIIRAANQSFNVITLGANAHYSAIIDLQIQGGATVGVNQGQWGIFTLSQAAPNDITIQRVVFSGPDAATGLVNAVLNDGLGTFAIGARWKLLQNHVERVWGTVSGTGYGFLLSRAWGAVVLGNTFLGTSGRGRHAIYGPLLRSCHIGENTIDSFTDTAILLVDYAITDAVPGAERCDVIGNVIRGGGFDSPGVSGIGLYGQVRYCNVVGNVIDGHKGRASIECSRAATAGTPQDNCIIANSISNGDQFGINVQGSVGTAVLSNSIQDCSLLSSGTYAAIKIQSDNGANVSDRTQVIGNVARGPTHRAGLSLDSATPTPTNTHIRGNYFPDYQTTPIETNGVLAQIEDNGYARSQVSGDMGDADSTWTATVSEPIRRHSTALTAIRTHTLSNTNAYNGAYVRVTRESTCTGAFNLNVNNGTGGLLKSLTAASQWADFYWQVSGWTLTASGSL